VFLVSRNGLNRSVRDVIRSELPVFTGAHVRIDGATIEEKLARALLVPGTNFDPAEFAHRLSISKQRATELIGQYETLRLVIPLLKYSALAPQSCIELADFRFDYNGCLLNLYTSSTDPAVERLAAERLWGLEEETRLLRGFVSNPEGYLAWAAMGERAKRQDILLILAQHPDKAVRSVACGELRGIAPGAPGASACGEAVRAR
jgi:hypothetical protein